MIAGFAAVMIAGGTFLKDSDTSEAAYSLLHSRFPRNPWTAKMPNWF
jgi:hypothetical protein